MPRQDSHLQSPDSESGDLLIRPLGSGWGSRGDREASPKELPAIFPLTADCFSTQLYPISIRVIECKPPKSDLNGRPPVLRPAVRLRQQTGALTRLSYWGRCVCNSRELQTTRTAGFEPATFSSASCRAIQLRHALI